MSKKKVPIDKILSSLKLMKANKDQLPEEYKFLLDQNFQEEIESIKGNPDRILAAAKIVGDEIGEENMDQQKIDELVNYLKTNGLLDGPKKDGDDEEIEEAPEEGQEETEEGETEAHEEGETPEEEASEHDEVLPNESESPDDVDAGDVEGPAEDDEEIPEEEMEEPEEDGEEPEEEVDGSPEPGVQEDEVPEEEMAPEGEFSEEGDEEGDEEIPEEGEEVPEEGMAQDPAGLQEEGIEAPESDGEEGQELSPDMEDPNNEYADQPLGDEVGEDVSGGYGPGDGSGLEPKDKKILRRALKVIQSLLEDD